MLTALQQFTNAGLWNTAVASQLHGANVCLDIPDTCGQQLLADWSAGLCAGAVVLK